mgnify:CR=1 FL=1
MSTTLGSLNSGCSREQTMIKAATREKMRSASATGASARGSQSAIAQMPQLTVHCLSEYVDNLEMAINLTANKAVNMQQVKAKPVEPD